MLDVDVAPTEPGEFGWLRCLKPLSLFGFDDLFAVMLCIYVLHFCSAFILHLSSAFLFSRLVSSSFLDCCDWFGSMHFV